jgi:hypothetical protein
VLAPLLASLSLLGADEPRICHGQLKPPTVVEQAMAYRRMFGLPSGRRYVRRVQRSGARRDDQGYAFTRREWRYWRMRTRIELSDKRRVERYLDRRPGLSGGISIEDDWPAGPYLQVRVTRDPAVHQSALRRLYRHRLRAVAVEHPDPALQALRDRISADRDALEAEGFDIRGLGIDQDANRVVVHMVSSRSDHQQVFQERYGPAVLAFATPDDERLECEELDGYRVSSTGRSLVLLWTHSSGEELATVELTEHADRVEVGIVQRVPFFGGPDDARFGRTRVQLAAPLRGRRVIDAATGLTPSRARSACCDGRRR